MAWLENFNNSPYENYGIGTSSTDVSYTNLSSIKAAMVAANATTASQLASTITSTNPYSIGAVTNIQGAGFGAYQSQSSPNNVIQFSNAGKEIVRLDKDGSVVWNESIKIDDAAEAFAKSLSLGAEIKSSITSRVKREMRDSVFESLIEIAKEKGALTADDLTYLLSASKIVEKLRGGSE